MKKILLILFVSINFYVHAQVDSLFQVPGTHSSMVPPKGFEKAETFSGFQQPLTGSSIMITELPTNYMVIVNSFTADALAKAGLLLISNDTISFNGKKAYTFFIKQKAEKPDRRSGNDAGRPGFHADKAVEQPDAGSIEAHADKNSQHIPQPKRVAIGMS